MSRHYRRMWSCLRICGLIPLVWSMSFVGLVLANDVAGLRIFGMQSAISDFQRVEYAALQSMYWAVGILALLLVGRYRAWSIRASAACMLGIVALLVALAILQRNFADGDMPQIGLVVVSVMATGVGLAAALGIARGHGGPFRAERVAATFDRLTTERRRTYHRVSWKRLPVLIPAALCICVLYVMLSLANIYVFQLAGVDARDAFWRDGAMQDFIDTHTGAAVLAYVGTLVTTSAWLVGVWIALRFTWRFVKPGADAVIADPAYRPVLFLRSFEDEEARVASRLLLRSLFRWRARLEEVLVRRLARLGPAVAVGLPGERMPRLGAYRAYYKDDAWQGAVLDWMERAHLIVVSVGSSPWVTWELVQCLAGGHRRRLVLVLPGDATSTARLARWRALCDALAGSPWWQALAATDGQDVLCLVLADGGAVYVFRGSSRHQVDYELSLQAAIMALDRPRFPDA